MGQVVYLYQKHDNDNFVQQDIGKILACRVHNLLFIADHPDYRKHLEARGTLRPLRALLADVLNRILTLKRKDKEQYRLFLYCFNKMTKEKKYD